MSRTFSRLFLAAALLWSLPAYADHVSIGGGANISGPIIVMPASTLKSGSVVFGLSTEFIKNEPFSDAELIDKASRHVHAHSTYYMLTTSASAAYGITDDLMISARLPYFYRENIRAGNHGHSGGGVSNTAVSHGDAGAFGDLMLTGKYRFWNRNTLESAVMLGIELPTGENGNQKHGEKLETEHQGGSGSWDPLLGLSVSKQWNGFSFDASAVYLRGMKGAQNINLGDRLNYGVAVSHRIGGELHDHGKGVIHQHKSWDLVLEYNAEWYGQQKDGDVRDRNSGGMQALISPGVRFAQDGWSGSVSLGIPVQSNFRQGHSDTDYKLMLSLSKGF